MSEAVRSTQRAPRSCLDCTKRKVRCNKRIPCDVCIRRGKASTCSRERVKVKGRLVRVTESDEVLSYEDLLQENAQLRILLNESAVQPGSDNDTEVIGLSEDLEVFDNLLFESLNDTRRRSTVTADSDVEFPSISLSRHLLAQGYKTSSWSHFAVHHPTFEREHDLFWESCVDLDQRRMYDPFWLSLYFSFISSVALFNDDISGYDNVDSERPTTPDLVRKWYDSALYYLHRADFLRVPDIRTVQAISILTNCFNTVGDFNFYQTLVPLAVRTAQILKIDRESDLASKTFIEREVCRRVWWTLVICEWLSVPSRVPCINESDFDVNMPSIADDHEIRQDGISKTNLSNCPRPIHYHIAMIRTAQVKHRFRSALKTNVLTQSDVVKLVIKVDEDLAHIIDGLPSYLRADSNGSPLSSSLSLPHGEEKEIQFPWIPWQRVRISLVLLSLRMRVNRILQGAWSGEGTLLRRIRSICLGSSNAIITLALQGDVPQKYLNTWGPLSHLLSAAVTLLQEAQLTETEVLDEEICAVRKLCETLRGMQAYNKVAANALQFIDRMLAK